MSVRRSRIPRWNPKRASASLPSQATVYRLTPLMRRLRRPAFFVAAVFALTGCPPEHNESQIAARPCKRFGDSCVYSAGKLGTCVMREGCTGQSCLFCQSQH